MSFWIALSVLAVLSLLVFARGPNAVWGGCTIGFVVGLLVALVYFLLGHGFSWILVGRITIVAVLLGALFELVGRVAARGRATSGQS